MFKVPEIEIIHLTVQDIITTSPIPGDDNFGSAEEEP